ncbi:MAG: class I SAM-dependent methyltransferase [Gaiellaceae bacterium]
MVIIKKLYRALVPTSVRKSSVVAKLRSLNLKPPNLKPLQLKPPNLKPLKLKLKSLLVGQHDSIYDSDYYKDNVEGPATRSAGRIADSILNDFKAASVIDVGCGTGSLLEALRERGCEVFGLEYAKAALRYCRARGLNVAKFDLKKDVLNENRTFDVAVSMEVAEHLPETVADRYVDLLTRLSRIVVLTAAPPGQGGTSHINEQPPSYWITKFQQWGFEHVEELSQRWRETWEATGDVEWWYHQNLMIFRRVRSI